MAIKVIVDECIGCGDCVKACPFDAIDMVDNKAVINDKCTVCGICVDVCPVEAIIQEEEIKIQGINIDEYRGVWVFAEQRKEELLNVSLELIGEGRKIADELETELTAVLLGNDVDNLGEQLIKYGADNVIYADSEFLDVYTTDAYTKVIHELIVDRKPEIFLIGATNIGRDLGPRLSARVHTGLTADCTRLEVDLETRGLLQTRPAFGGNLMATIKCPNHRPQMSTVRPGVMEKLKVDEKRKGNIEKFTPDLKAEDIKARVIEFVKGGKAEVKLEEAPIIVAGGRGLGDKKGFELIEELAEKLGGVVGASRATVDAGWIEQTHQVGQTGKTVRPPLYIACGISGAIQHLAGMQEAECIVAINNDPGAAIFEVADYAIVGDVYEVIPELIESLDDVDGIMANVKNLHFE